MKIKHCLIATGLIGLTSIALANPGDVTVINDNEIVLNSQAALQFQLVTNGGGLVTSAALSAKPPNNVQTLNTDSFSDQTQEFKVYVRDASNTQNPYISCAGLIPYQHDGIPIKIHGWSDPSKGNCKIELAVSQTTTDSIK